MELALDWIGLTFKKIPSENLDLRLKMAGLFYQANLAINNPAPEALSKMPMRPTQFEEEIRSLLTKDHPIALRTYLEDGQVLHYFPVFSKFDSVDKGSYDDFFAMTQRSFRVLMKPVFKDKRKKETFETELGKVETRTKSKKEVPLDLVVVSEVDMETKEEEMETELYLKKDPETQEQDEDDQGNNGISSSSEEENDSEQLEEEEVIKELEMNRDKGEIAFSLEYLEESIQKLRRHLVFDGAHKPTLKTILFVLDTAAQREIDVSSVGREFIHSEIEKFNYPTKN